MELERSQVHWGSTDRALIDRIRAHLDAIALRNERWLWPHPKRVARLSAAMGVKLGLPEKECYVLGETGLTHDHGKNHPESQAWIRAHMGKGAPEHEIEEFRRMHTTLGKIMFPLLDLTDVRATPEEIEAVYLHHHEPYNRIPDPHKKLVAVVQVADCFDAPTSGELEHSYVRMSEEDALRNLYRDGSCGIRDLVAVNALTSSLGLTFA